MEHYYNLYVCAMWEKLASIMYKKFQNFNGVSRMIKCLFESMITVVFHSIFLFRNVLK
jgi:hypothetical protein